VRGRGGGGKAVAARKEWASHHCVPQGIRPESVRVLAQSTNLSSRASYRHGGRGPLPTKCREMPPIKTLMGETSGTRSPTEPWHLDQPNKNLADSSQASGAEAHGENRSTTLTLNRSKFLIALI
jgi:hypothetical protein